MRTTSTLLLAIVLLASCNQFQKTPSGLSYKITSGGSKDKLKHGQFVKFNIEYKVPPKDSVLTSSYGHVPAYLVIDTSRPNKHSFLEIITQCAVGDKIEFSMSVDTLKKLGMIEYNNIFHARDMIKGRVEILKVFDKQELASADLAKEQELEKQKEIKELQEFTAKKGIKTVSTPSGVLVEIQTPGDAQFKADSGKQVTLMYKGTFLDGKQFDSNMDKNSPNNQPLQVVVGTQGVIQGMDEALRLFSKGAKGKMYIPAMLAYGQNGQPPVIPQYSNLVFEIEMLDVTTPAPQPAQPAGPQGQPQQPQRK
ncbi:MAG: FKBP-type peptidyl-prolyl cis-trans isomerase [Chitinophagaceae bacterium]|nr:FKBP-type peptidyl-prolyl cis-trans isomerase [Chitinophagaceae bacterium]MCA6455770.1 FKBP-type peptidyl-prolyl cis-trans isomerase [Chitinophagaceae bacterium]MCA6464947.1 FKBP-type peptidyl-prolyl cis-trans isomerase [Chitinophagaceae bacterium]MEA3425003.1 FKBP-type peptidyl-prolyl cis-trans isomerase [Bacteroidota bacterium]